MKKGFLKWVAVFGFCCTLFFIAVFAVKPVGIDEKITTPISFAGLAINLEYLRQAALDDPNEENVKAFLLAQKGQIEREKKFESVKGIVLSKDPKLQAFYENHEMELRMESARKRFIEETYQSAFYDAAIEEEKSNEE